MTLITALEIAGNYPENILIDTQKDPSSDNWTSLMYMTCNGRIIYTSHAMNHDRVDCFWTIKELFEKGYKIKRK